MEWGNVRNDGFESDYLTEWQFEDNQGKAIAIEWAVGSGLSVEVHRYHLTPEQAIAATLGTGTCHIKPWKMERDTGFYDCMECECGYVSDVSDWAKWHFCPNCGRRIEQ